MSNIRAFLQDTPIPRFYRVRQAIDDTHIEDVAEAVREALRRPGTLDCIRPGSTVCFTGSSREIANSVTILRTLAEEFRRVGARPTLIPAMGSHAGAVAEAQKALLAHYGITEESIGCPIYASMDTVEVGRTPEGLSVHMDAFAASCDYVVPVGRIKAHTLFHGPFESGIMKMMAIGLGKQHGAHECHQYGMAALAQHVPAFGRVMLANCKIPFGVGIVENGLHQTYRIAAVPNACIEDEEPQLLALSKSLMPSIPFPKVDVIMVERIGKDVSGDGMDPNIIGRDFWCHKTAPFAERIGVLDLTEKTGGNFCGLSLADAATARLFGKLSFEETYPNNITNYTPEGGRIPMILPTDRLCFQLCLNSCIEHNPEYPRVVWLRDTLHLDEFYVSEKLYAEAAQDARLTVCGGICEAVFDEAEAFAGWREA